VDLVRETPAQVIDALRTGRYRFLDAGCGDGGSTDQLTRRFGRSPGLGVDWYPEAVRNARAAGFDAMFCNLLDPDLELPEGCVEYAAAMDVLEHLPSPQDAVAVLRKLANAARDFLMIRHPSFDDIDYLAQFGLKLNWTDWTCHPNPMKIDDFRRIFKALGWRDYTIVPHMNYADSSHASVLPLQAPTDTLKYDPALHGAKPAVTFDRPVYGKFDIFVRCGPIDPADWPRIASVDGWEAHWDF
jgi:SAM-dependent methyltransferase